MTDQPRPMTDEEILAAATQPPQQQQMGPHMLTSFGTSPVAVAFQQLTTPDGQNLIALMIETVHGSFAFGWPSEDAASLGRQLVEVAEAHLNSGLVVPPQAKTELIVPGQ